MSVIERPILFSGSMVRGVREDRKTMTRRVVKPQPFDVHGSAFMKTTKCPFGQPGDQLYVRETFVADEYMGCRYKADGKQFLIINGEKTKKEFVVKKWTPSIHMPRWASRITLEVTNVSVERLNDISDEDALSEGIREENVIVGATCAGGMHRELTEDRYFFDGGDEDGYDDAVSAFKALWETINGPGSWAANPWVWVVEFKVVKK